MTTRSEYYVDKANYVMNKLLHQSYPHLAVDSIPGVHVPFPVHGILAKIATYGSKGI